MWTLSTVWKKCKVFLLYTFLYAIFELLICITFYGCIKFYHRRTHFNLQSFLHTLLREYFPKTVDINQSDSYVEAKMKEINLKPRKCLSWKTPYEVYHSVELHLTWQFKTQKTPLSFNLLFLILILNIGRSYKSLVFIWLFATVVIMTRNPTNKS